MLITISMIWFASIGPSVGQGTPTPTASPTLPVISLSNADKLASSAWLAGVPRRRLPGLAMVITWL
jgi:hypothetical protein